MDEVAVMPVMVKVVLSMTSVGLPLMIPETGSMLSPSGSQEKHSMLHRATDREAQGC